VKLAVVGATGLVGNEIMEVLNEFNFEIDQFIPVASARSAGKTIQFRGQDYIIKTVEEAIALKPDVALFSAGGSTSKAIAKDFTATGCYVIDNSSAWRMDPEVPLVVPEINGHQLNEQNRLIANPNCSTIQMVGALAPLHSKFNIKRLVISTYQSFTGTGVQAVKQYEEERRGNAAQNPAYPHPIFENCLPHCDIFLDNGYTKEEMKLVHETRKIMGDDNIRITATAVRVPVHGGHSEAVNIEFEHQYEVSEVVSLLEKTPGIVVQDDIKNNVYPMPLSAKKKNDIFVGRIRRDESIDNGLNLWVVSDNLRKGAATNAVQIAMLLKEKGILNSTYQAV